MIMIYYQYENSELCCIELELNSSELSYEDLSLIFEVEGINSSTSIYYEGRTLLEPGFLIPVSDRMDFELRSNSQELFPLLSEYFATEEAYIDLDLNQITLMYAAPLVKSNGFLDEEIGQNLDLAREKSLFLRLFGDSNVTFQVASLANLRRAIEKRSKIIHISCHGYYRKSDHEFVLAFESSKHIGKLEEVTSAMLQDELALHEQYTNMVVISACFSHAIADIFIKGGFDCVVSIDDYWEIMDNTVIKFEEAFYSLLKKGEKIGVAFDKAQESVSDQDEEVCCCRHLHKEWCKWQKKLCKEHIPDCQCRKHSTHKLDCPWAVNFLNKYNPERKPTAEEINANEWVVCCCSEEISHDNSMKFTKYMTDEIASQMVLTKYSCQEKPETYFKFGKFEGKLYKRNADVQHLLRLVHMNRMIVVYGARGVGKTALVKFAASYAEEREVFANGVIYIDLKRFHHSKDITRGIASALGFEPHTHSHIVHKKISDLDLLIILDSIERIFNRYEQVLVVKINKILQCSKNTKIWIISEKPLYAETTFHNFILRNIPKLSLLKILRDRLNRQIFKDKLNELKSMIKRYDFTPGEVVEIAEKLNSGMNLEEFLEKEDMKVDKGLEEHRCIVNLDSKHSRIASFVNLLAMFPSGISLELMNFLIVNHSYQGYLEILENDQIKWIEKSDNVCVNPDLLNAAQNQSYREKNALLALKFLSSFCRTIAVELTKRSPFDNSKALNQLTSYTFFPLHHSIPSGLSDYIVNLPTTMIMQLYDRMETNVLQFIDIEFLKNVFGVYIDPPIASFIYDLSESVISVSLMTEQFSTAFSVLDNARHMLKRYSVPPRLHKSKSASEPYKPNEPYFKIKLISTIMIFKYKNNYGFAYKEIKKLMDVFCIHSLVRFRAEASFLTALILIKSREVETGIVETHLSRAEKDYDQLNDLIGIAKTAVVHLKCTHSITKIEHLIKKLQRLLPSLESFPALHSKIGRKVNMMYRKHSY